MKQSQIISWKQWFQLEWGRKKKKVWIEENNGLEIREMKAGRDEEEEIGKNCNHALIDLKWDEHNQKSMRWIWFL